MEGLFDPVKRVLLGDLIQSRTHFGEEDGLLALGGSFKPLANVAHGQNGIEQTVEHHQAAQHSGSGRRPRAANRSRIRPEAMSSRSKKKTAVFSLS